MSIIGPNIADGTATVFVWLAEKVLGGVKRALGWGWDQARWNLAQDVYDSEIIKRYGKVRIFGQVSPKSLRDIFTDVYVLDKPTAYRRFPAESLAAYLWNEDRGLSFRHGEAMPGERLLSQGSKFFIIGKPGAGKTTFLYRLAVREAQRGRWGRCLGKVPIFVTLKQYARSNKPLFDFIVDQFSVCHFPNAAPFVEKLLESGQALILFDGLDEVTGADEFQANDRNQVTEVIEQFARQYNDCHVIITCRIAATDFTFDPMFTYLEVSDFAPDQVEAFVRSWFQNEGDYDSDTVRAERMLRDISLPEHKGIRDLARNPLLLTMLCLNYSETSRFPMRRAEIYEEALDALLRRWDASRYIDRRVTYRNLSLGRRRQMFAHIAYRAFERNEILFTQSNLEFWIKDYLKLVPELPNSIDIDGDAVLQEIIEQHGIFAVQSYNLYSFAHITFQEYYAAKYVADNADVDVLQSFLLHVDDSKWREVFLLTASLIPNGSTLLATFEHSLHQLLDRSPRLVAWLRWIAGQALASQAGYRQPATRAWYILALAYHHALNRSLTYTLDRATDLELVQSLKRSLTLARNFTLARDLTLARGRGLALKRTLERSRFLVRTCDSELARYFSSGVALALDFDHAQIVARNLDDDLSLDLNLARDLDRDLILERGASFERESVPVLIHIRQSLLEYCDKRRRPNLRTSISLLDEPSANASLGEWQWYTTELMRVVNEEHVLDPLNRLLTETDVLIGESWKYWDLRDEDMVLLLEYVRAAQVFYECTQASYVPDRQGLEERFFLPPPTKIDSWAGY